jgi:hypothetical protein
VPTAAPPVALAPPLGPVPAETLEPALAGVPAESPPELSAELQASAMAMTLKIAAYALA